jgi:putative ABC transport system ATP-binding protein
MESIMSNLLQATDLTKTFGTENNQKVTILNSINLEIKEGEFVAIMGQSGSGKSTLLYNISGMDCMTSGEVSFGGENYSNMSGEVMSKYRLENMGFIFQHSHLLKNLSIEDNILLPGLKLRKMPREIVYQRAKQLMKKMGIDNVANHDINKVSGGQLQRAAICRALINQPKIIFGDEPTGALNSSSTTAVMDIMNNINQSGTTILIVTHDAKVAARADRAIFLSDGKITAECVLGKYKEYSDTIEREEKVKCFLKEKQY